MIINCEQCESHGCLSVPCPEDVCWQPEATEERWNEDSLPLRGMSRENLAPQRGGGAKSTGSGYGRGRARDRVGPATAREAAPRGSNRAGPAHLKGANNGAQ